MGRINRQQVMIELQSAQPTIKKLAHDYAKAEIFDKAVAEMEQEFKEHDVTQEIIDGSKKGNSAGSQSGAVSGIGKSPKNLFTFIGFEEGSDPTKQIAPFFKPGGDGPRMVDLPVVKRRFIYQFEIFAPNLKEIYKNTPVPWAEGLSWAKKVEDGIDGLAFFLAKEGIGRSGGGIQVKSEVGGKRQKRSKPVKYLSEIIENFINKFK